ncbi:MAG: hypothetical protein ACI33S_04870 [Bacilli bacterium]
MRFILKIIRIIICLFLYTFLLIKVFFISQEYLYENEYPGVYGYSILKIKNDYLSPDIEKNSYVILQSKEEYEVGDIVYYSGKNISKIIEIREEETSVEDESNPIIEDVIELKDNREEVFITSKNDIYGKVIYNNKKISTTINILTHPIVILLLIIFSISISSLTYKRYS